MIFFHRDFTFSRNYIYIKAHNLLIITIFDLELILRVITGIKHLRISIRIILFLLDTRCARNLLARSHCISRMVLNNGDMHQQQAINDK